MRKAGPNTVTEKLKWKFSFKSLLACSGVFDSCNPMDWGILEWAVISSSRELPDPGIEAASLHLLQCRRILYLLSLSAGKSILHQYFPSCNIFKNASFKWNGMSNMTDLWRINILSKCGILSSRAQCDSQYCSQPAEAVPLQGSDGGRAGAENLTYDFWLGYRLTRKCE